MRSGAGRRRARHTRTHFLACTVNHRSRSLVTRRVVAAWFFAQECHRESIILRSGGPRRDRAVAAASSASPEPASSSSSSSLQSATPRLSGTVMEALSLE